MIHYVHSLLSLLPSGKRTRALTNQQHHSVDREILLKGISLINRNLSHTQALDLDLGHDALIVFTTVNTNACLNT